MNDQSVAEYHKALLAQMAKSNHKYEASLEKTQKDSEACAEILLHTMDREQRKGLAHVRIDNAYEYCKPNFIQKLVSGPRSISPSVVVQHMIEKSKNWPTQLTISWPIFSDRFESLIHSAPSLPKHQPS